MCPLRVHFQTLGGCLFLEPGFGCGCDVKNRPVSVWSARLIHTLISDKHIEVCRVNVRYQLPGGSGSGSGGGGTQPARIQPQSSFLVFMISFLVLFVFLSHVLTPSLTTPSVYSSSALLLPLLLLLLHLQPLLLTLLPPSAAVIPFPPFAPARVADPTPPLLHSAVLTATPSPLFLFSNAAAVPPHPLFFSCSQHYH